MKLLEDKILSDGVVKEGDILLVGSFLNQQIDIDLAVAMGKELYESFRDCGVTKILTIEASGIALACLTAQFFHAPVVFAKKSRSANVKGDTYTSTAYSFTHKVSNTIVVPKDFIGPQDTVLIVDDFLATGEAVRSLVDIVSQAGAKIAGVGISVEKAYQNGGADLRKAGLRVESLARIASMSPATGVVFCRN